jgi:hypothetical protein
MSSETGRFSAAGAEKIEKQIPRRAKAVLGMTKIRI